jgi:RNA polymerase sigma-70 factor (family 1)
MDDQILVSQLKEGSHLAFTSLYKQYAPQAYSLAYKYLCNKDLAEDVVQNLFLKIWNIRNLIDETRPFNRFLFTILKNSLLNILRDSKSNVFVLDDCLEVLNYIDNPNEEESADIDEEQLEILKKAVERLSPQRRKIFSLKISGKYSNQEIADKMNLSINTIKFQYSQSLKLLKQYAREYSIILLIVLTI